jgi:hypothetical protein
MINFDRSEDWLLQKMGMEDILRDRIVMPPGDITLANARAALTQFETDLTQIRAMKASGVIETVIIDGGTLLTDIITIVKLDEAENPNKTFRYAGRNAYLQNLFNELNECGLNVVWTSKARDLWVANNKVPNVYTPDCHDEVPYRVDVNMQMIAEPSPEGQLFYGLIGTNAFNPVLVGKRIPNLDWAMLMALLGRSLPIRPPLAPTMCPESPPHRATTALRPLHRPA